MIRTNNILFILISLAVLMQNVQCELIVEVSTKLLINKVQADNTTSVVQTYDLNNFKFITKYNTNDTINGDYCYARTNATFIEECYNKKPDTDWIVVNPFDETESNAMILAATIEKNRIIGLIFISDQDINSQKFYERPELIAIMPKKYKDEQEQYSYNNITQPTNKTLTLKTSELVLTDDPPPPDPPVPALYTASIQHTFIQRCQVFENLIPILMVNSILYFLVFIIWCLMVSIIYKHNSFPLQKTLLVIPFLKALENLLFTEDFNNCPWVGENQGQSSEAFLRMGKVTSVTFSYTFIHALLYMLAKGWTTTSQVMDRNQATNLTVIMGAIYLLYSAYFLTSETVGIARVVNMIIAITYLFLGILNFKSLREQINFTKMYIADGEAEVPQAFQQSVILKNLMLRQYQYVIVGFFTPKFLEHGYMFMYSENEFIIQRIVTAVQVWDFFIFTFLLYVFRPRVWPEYFMMTLGAFPINRRQGNQNGQAQRNQQTLAPIKVSYIDEKFILDDKQEMDRKQFRKDKEKADSFGSFEDLGTDQALIIVNPCAYTLEDYIAPPLMLDNPYPQEIDEESQYQVQKGLGMAFRDPVQKERIDYLKQNGLYINKAGFVGFGLNGSMASQGSFIKRLSTKIFGSRQGSLKKQKSDKSNSSATAGEDVPNVQVEEESKFDFEQSPPPQILESAESQALISSTQSETVTEGSDYQEPLIRKSNIEKPRETRKLDDYQNPDYVSSSDEDDEEMQIPREK